MFMKLFLEAKKSINYKSKCNDISQMGRSMVEMLGVLAIIGVLSIGAIAGYQKAMFKYKMNKTIEISAEILYNSLELAFKNSGSLYISGNKSGYKYGLIPDTIYDDNYQGRFGNKGYASPSPIGGEIILECDYASEVLTDPPGMINFYISFPKNEKACVDFLSYHWERSFTENNISIYCYRDNLLLYDSHDKSVNYTLNDIQNFCNTCQEKDSDHGGIDIDIWL